MKAEYVDVHFGADGTEILGVPKTIQLPFRRASVRAIVVRRMDGALLGTLHHLGGSYALPGGAIDDSESAAQAIQRELAEENITLIGSDEDWEERIFVDYFAGYHELAVWYLFIVDDAEILPSHETVETSWLAQDERVWYPGMRAKLLLALHAVAPGLARFNLEWIEK